MTALCEKTSLVIAQLYQSADASFFIVDFIGKIQGFFEGKKS